MIMFSIIILLYESHIINNFLSFIYISLSIFLLHSSVIVSELFFGEFFETFVVLSAILLSVMLPVVFSIALFEAVSSASVADFLA